VEKTTSAARVFEINGNKNNRTRVHIVKAERIWETKDQRQASCSSCQEHTGLEEIQLTRAKDQLLQIKPGDVALVPEWAENKKEYRGKDNE